MLFELSVVPIGKGAHVSRDIAEAVEVIADAGLPYRLTPSSTCVEGEWTEVMPVIERAHRRLRENCPHVLTMIKIEDQADAANLLERNIRSVEEKAGRAFAASGAPQPLPPASH